MDTSGDAIQGQGQVDQSVQGQGQVDQSVQGQGQVDQSVQGQGQVDQSVQGQGQVDQSVQGQGQVDQSGSIGKKWYEGGSINIRGFTDFQEIAHWKQLKNPEFYNDGMNADRDREGQEAGGVSGLNPQMLALVGPVSSEIVHWKQLKNPEFYNDGSNADRDREGQEAGGVSGLNPQMLALVGPVSSIKGEDENVDNNGAHQGSEGNGPSAASNDSEEAPTDQDKTTELDEIKRRLENLERHFMQPSVERRGRPTKDNASKIIRCETCPKLFSTSASKTIHVQSVHQGRRWPCGYCDREFASPAAKCVHMKLCVLKPTNREVTSSSSDAAPAVRVQSGPDLGTATGNFKE